MWRRLLDLERIFGGATGEPSVIPLTQEELAQVVGATRPTVNRCLKEGEDAGVLRVSRGRVELLDRDALGRKAR